MNAYIKNLAYYLPENKFSNSDLAKSFPDWTLEKVTSKIGISERHIASDNETAQDMAVKAAFKLFEEHNISPSSIDFILLCTQSPDYFLPTSACIIQSRLGIPTTAGAFDFNLGCSGFVYGLLIAKGLIAGNIADNVLLLTSDTYSKFIHPRDKGNRAIFGDGATATIISYEGFAEIGSFIMGTDGRGADNLIVKTGGLRHREKKSDITFNDGNPASSDFLFMNGPEIFNFTLDIVPILIKDVLKKNNLEEKEINLFILHQANKYILDFLRRKIGIDEQKFYYFLEKTGNTVSSTIPIALHEARKEGKLNGHVLLAGFGVGYSWGGTVLKVNLL